MWSKNIAKNIGDLYKNKKLEKRYPKKTEKTLVIHIQIKISHLFQDFCEKYEKSGGPKSRTSKNSWKYIYKAIKT